MTFKPKINKRSLALIELTKQRMSFSFSKQRKSPQKKILSEAPCQDVIEEKNSVTEILNK